MVVGSHGVTAGSTDSSLSATAGVFLLGGNGCIIRRTYRDALTSSSVASCARLETPSLA
jgi:hypothetical protein